ncbi:MAG: hypothetical protein V1848_02920 [Candidatus Magasanikbacteria bacterium]
MRIYIGHANKSNYEEELYTPLKESPIHTLHKIIFPHDTERKNTKESIQTCDLFIAEVSTASTGLGIELGWANNFGKKIICVYKQGTIISRSLKEISNTFIEYTDAQDLIQKIQEKI